MNALGTPLVEMRDISLAFGGIHAVDRVSIDLYPGEVMALVGHNGAGKSTLIKILAGAYQRDYGTISDSRRGGDNCQSARRQEIRHRDDLSDAGACRQYRRRRQSVSRPRIAHALGHARR